MRTIRRAMATIVVLGMLAGLGLSGSALAQDASTSATDEPLTFIIGLTNNIVTVNPLRAIEAPEYELLSMQYNLLFDFAKEDMSAVPGPRRPRCRPRRTAGSRPTASPGRSRSATTLTWSDGEPLTANDVAFTYNLILDQNWSTFTNYLPFTDCIEATDDTTLVWKTTEPSIAPLIPPWIYILPEHVCGGMTKDEIRDVRELRRRHRRARHVGPVPAWWSGTRTRTGRSRPTTDYFGGAPTLDRVIFKRYTNDETMVPGPEGRRDRLRGIRSRSTCSQSLQDEPGIADERRRLVLVLADELQPVLRAEGVRGQHRTPRAQGPRPCARRSRWRSTRRTSSSASSADTARRHARSSCRPSPFWHWDPADAAIPASTSKARTRCSTRPDTPTATATASANMPGGGENLEFRFIVPHRVLRRRQGRRS